MRAADAMLRALSGDQIALVLPRPAVGTDPGSQLGLSDPGVQQVFISPVVVRNLSTPGKGPTLRLEFLLSAFAVATTVDAEGAGSVEALFDSALGVQYQANLFHIESLTTDYFAGTAYLYRVTAVE